MKNLRLGLTMAMGLLLASCNTRYHLAGEMDGGYGSAGIGAAGIDGGGSAGADGGRDAQPDAPTMVVPSPLGISAREALTRVARVLWESPPDQTLVAMADSGAVTTDADVRRIARGMLDDPRARVGVGNFYRWWLNLDALSGIMKDPSLFPDYSSTLATSMAAETQAFGVSVTLDGDGRFPTLMQGSYSFLNAGLAKLYGVSGVTSTDLVKVDLDPTQRAGIFTQGAFLTQTSGQDTWTSPTHRGMFVFDKMFCRVVPPPPAGLFQAPPMQTDTQSNRQWLTASTNMAPVCQSCHSMSDPIGFAYEGFDSIGRVRTTDRGQMIDASGHASLASGEYSWNSAVDLAQVLAKLPEAHQCMGSQWLQYMLGRALTDADVPSVTLIGQLFEASNLDLRAVIAAAAASPMFLSRGGGTPCTPGADQTCNANPMISSLHGSCTPAGKCVCSGTFILDTATGRCN